MSDPTAVEPAKAPSLPVPAPAILPISGALGMFYGQLSGLVKAGMPLPQALRTLAADSGSKRFRAALDRSAEAIERGQSPSEAFARESNMLGGMLGRVTAAAAASGRLAQLLSELSAWTLTQDRIRRKITDSLLYPYIVLLLSSVMGVVMLVLSETLLRDIHEEWGVEPPGINTARIVSSIFIVLVFSCSLAVPLAKLIARFSAGVRLTREQCLISMPAVGAICRSLALSRFCGAVAVMLKAQMPLADAVEAAGQLTGYSPYEQAAIRAADSIREGRPMDEAWGNRRLFPQSLRFILNSAEKRGDMPEAFAELAQLYQMEAEGRGSVLSIVAPPLFLVVTGVLAGASIYGVLLPVFQLFGIMDAMGR